MLFFCAIIILLSTPPEQVRAYNKKLLACVNKSAGGRAAHCYYRKSRNVANVNKSLLISSQSSSCSLFKKEGPVLAALFFVVADFLLCEKDDYKWVFFSRPQNGMRRVCRRKRKPTTQYIIHRSRVKQAAKAKYCESTKLKIVLIHRQALYYCLHFV